LLCNISDEEVKAILRKILPCLIMLALIGGCIPAPKGTRVDEDKKSSGIVDLLRGSPAMIGKLAPDAVVKSMSGADVRLKGTFGSGITMLLFSSTSCSYSTQEHTEIQRVLDRLGKRVNVVTVFVKETLESAREYVASNPVPGTVLIDTTGKARETYGVELVPTVYLIDSRGTINHFANFTPAEDMVATVLRIERGQRTTSVRTTGGG
jgi:peroxiredoxin